MLFQFAVMMVQLFILYVSTMGTGSALMKSGRALNDPFIKMDPNSICPFLKGVEPKEQFISKYILGPWYL
jgi:hypothetical protein